MTDPAKRPKNREVEHEMIHSRTREGKPPKPATEPTRPRKPPSRKHPREGRGPR